MKNVLIIAGSLALIGGGIYFYSKKKKEEQKVNRRLSFNFQKIYY
jgi:LPXTG-motif cell wall-anchored protein